jgi:hypothetical protein
MDTEKTVRGKKIAKSLQRHLEKTGGVVKYLPFLDELWITLLNAPNGFDYWLAVPVWSEDTPSDKIPEFIYTLDLYCKSSGSLYWSLTEEGMEQVLSMLGYGLPTQDNRGRS